VVPLICAQARYNHSHLSFLPLLVGLGRFWIPSFLEDVFLVGRNFSFPPPLPTPRKLSPGFSRVFSPPNGSGAPELLSALPHRRNCRASLILRSSILSYYSAFLFPFFHSLLKNVLFTSLPLRVKYTYMFLSPLKGCTVQFKGA